jgi:integrase
MPRPSRTPTLRHHKASGQGFVEIEGKRIYLGRFDLPETHQKYHALIAEWLSNGRKLPVPPDEVTIVELIAAFWAHAQIYYRHPDGTPTSELGNFNDALEPLKRLYGHSLAAEFKPLALQALQQEMIRQGWCRTNINRQINRIRHVVKWGVAKGMVPPGVFHGLQAVSGLKAGRSEARESKPVKPVAEAHVQATLGFLSPTVRAMVELQLLTGMRPGEVCGMRGCDIDTTGTLWSYTPGRHKTAHHGHERVILLGPKAREIVKAHLKPDLHAHVFSPSDSERWRRAKAHAERKTPLKYGNTIGDNRKSKPRRTPGDRYTVESYGRAIKYATEKAFPLPPNLAKREDESKGDWVVRLTKEERAEAKAWHKANAWHPHQLRHTAATKLRKEHGLEAAQVILGHKTLTVTKVYAEKNVEAAHRIMAEVG